MVGESSGRGRAVSVVARAFDRVDVRVRRVLADSRVARSQRAGPVDRHVRHIGGAVVPGLVSGGGGGGGGRGAGYPESGDGGTGE